MAPPQWALKTLNEAWQLAERDDQIPELVWRRSRGNFYSSGHCSVRSRRIVVTAGTKAPRWEQRMLLLHEVAHAMCREDEHHGDMFWRTAWALYRDFGLPVRSVLKREESYRKGARAGYLATRPTR